GKALLDSEGRMVEVNPALCRIVGRHEESLRGHAFESLFEDDESSLRPNGDGTTDANGIHRVTRHLRREGDLPREAQLTYAPVPGNIGQDITGLVEVEDVTERVRAQARVHALNRTLEARVALRTRELSQANQELEAFAYSVSHDLRAPLRSIDGFSRLLAEHYSGVLDQAGLEQLTRVRNAAGRMAELIDSLLKMSGVGRGGMTPVPLDLDRIAAEVLGELRAGEPERQVDAQIESPLHVVADQGLVRSLLQNLLGNAWKFSKDRPVARVDVGRNERGEFFVRDNGVGFAQEYADKLFRPFQRLHSQDEFGGHGIGLASVKRIVERHGGTIRAEGVPGERATFYFTLPEPVIE